MNRYEIYKETDFEWIGEIPFDWELSRVGKFFNERSVKVDDVSYPPLSVTMSGIVDQLSDVAKTKDGGNRKLVKKDDFVINSRSDRKGSSGIAPRDGSVSLINIVLEPHGLYPQFIEHLFKSYYFKEEYFRNGKGIHWDLWTTRWDQFKNINIPIPSIEEQKLIAHYLDKKTEQIDRLIDKTQKKIELLKEQRTALINQCVTKGLDPNVEMKDSGIEWIGEIPRGWDIIKVKFLGDIRSGDGITNTELSDDGEIPVYGGNGIVGYYDEFNSSHTVIIIGRVGEKCGNIHLVYEKCWISDNSLILTLRDDTNYPWVSICLNSRDLNKIRNQSSQPLITSTQVKNESIPFPSENQRKQISNYLDQETLKIDQMVDTQTKRIELLKEYRQSLISSVVTGKVLVTEDMI